MVVLSRGFIRPAQAGIISPVINGLSALPVIGERQTFDGVRGGKKPVKGELRINPLTISRTKGRCNYIERTAIPYFWAGSWRYDAYFQGEIAGVLNEIVEPPPIPYLHPDISINKALAKLNKPDLDVGLLLGEFTETLEMLRHPLSSLYPLITDLRKQARSRHRQKPSQPFSKILSSVWLENCYGIQPFLKDIQDIKEFWDKGIEHERGVLRRHAASTMRESAAQVSRTADTYYSQVTYSANTYASKRVTTHIYFKYNDWAREYERLTSFGVNPFQLLDVAYAIMPYSFVVNWFLDIGSWLKAIQPRPQLDILGGCTTIKELQSKSIETFMIRMTNPATSWVPCVSRYDWETSKLTRVLQTSWAAPPSIGNGIDNLSKTVNSLAMLWQRIPLKW